MTDAATDNVTSIKTKRNKPKAKVKAKVNKAKAKAKAKATPAPAKTGHNQYTQLASDFVSRLERLNRDRDAALDPIREDIKALGKEVKDHGYKMTAIREIVRRRAMSLDDRELVDQYEFALVITEKEKTE